MMSKEDVLAGVRAVLPGPDESVLFPLVDVDGDEVGTVCSSEAEFVVCRGGTRAERFKAVHQAVDWLLEAGYQVYP